MSSKIAPALLNFILCLQFDWSKLKLDIFIQRLHANCGHITSSHTGPMVSQVFTETELAMVMTIWTLSLSWVHCSENYVDYPLRAVVIIRFSARLCSKHSCSIKVLLVLLFLSKQYVGAQYLLVSMPVSKQFCQCLPVFLLSLSYRCW